MIALVCLVAFLAYANYTIFASPVETGPLNDERPKTMELSAQSGPKMPEPAPFRTLASLTETVRRPLFSLDRRPIVRVAKQAEAAKPQAVKPVTPPEQLQLVGIIQGSNARALIRSNSNTPGSWIVIGEDVEGWRLKEVSEISAILEAQNRKYELFLYSSAVTK
jgi:hypothetical protein